MRKTVSALVVLVTYLPLLCSCAGYRSTLMPSLSVNEQVTDNVDQSNSNPKDAAISTITPGLTYSLTGEHKALDLSLDPSFVYYSNGGGYTGESLVNTGGTFADTGASLADTQSVKLNASDQFAKHSLATFNDQFSRTDDPNPISLPTFVLNDQPLPPQDFTIRVGSELYYTNFANFNFRQDFGPDDSITCRYSNTVLNNNNPAIANNMTNSPSVDIKYWLNYLYGIEVSAAYTTGDFSVQQGAPIPSIDEIVLTSKVIRKFRLLDAFVQYTQTMVNFQGNSLAMIPLLSSTQYFNIYQNYVVYDFSSGVEYRLSPTVFFTMSGGYFVENIAGSQAGGYEAHADIAKKFRWIDLRLTGATGYDQAYFGAQNLGFGKFYGATFSGSYTFCPHLVGVMSAGYRYDNYVDADVNEAMTTFLVSLNYKIRPWSTASIAFTHNIANSSEEFVSYTEDRVSLTLTLTPKEPYVFGR